MHFQLESRAGETRGSGSGSQWRERGQFVNAASLVSVNRNNVFLFSALLFLFVKLKNFGAFIIQKCYICLSELSFLINFMLYLKSCGTELTASKGQNGIKMK